MLTLNDAKAIYVYPGTTDMRYGINVNAKMNMCLRILAKNLVWLRHEDG